ncbi:SymE family type I addiction module toxin [Elizabethkingia anophelis]|uniref:SymE family type I addiction module toxin n=1 Tax=Elizabethkingia anophelis TaxID=1117645 RepID=UPI0021A4C66E
MKFLNYAFLGIKHPETELIIPQTFPYFTTSLHNDIKNTNGNKYKSIQIRQITGNRIYSISTIKTHQIMCNVRFLTEEEENQIVLDTRYITVNRIPIKGHYNPHECCSKVQLQGRWIDKCGFKPNDKLTVSVYRNRLVIEKQKPNTINPKILAREQKANEKYVRERVRQLVSPDIFNRLSFKNGEIKWIK